MRVINPMNPVTSQIDPMECVENWREEQSMHHLYKGGRVRAGRQIVRSGRPKIARGGGVLRFFLSRTGLQSSFDKLSPGAKYNIKCSFPTSFSESSEAEQKLATMIRMEQTVTVKTASGGSAEASLLIREESVTTMDLSSLGLTRLPCSLLPKRLHRLNLAHNHLTSLPDLSSIEGLEVLDLEDNNLSSTLGLASLSLKILNLSKNSISRDEVTELRHTLPKCKIYGLGRK